MTGPKAEEAFVYVNVETGESVTECPHCLQAKAEVAELERDLRIKRTMITKLKRDKEAEARDSKYWPIAEVIYDWWRVACSHQRAKFNYQDFEDMKPRLADGKNGGALEVLKGIAGAAFDPGTRPMANGGLQRFDDLELVVRSPSKLRSFTQRVPGGEDGEAWRAWLSNRVKELAPLEHERMLNQLKHALEMEKT